MTSGHIILALDTLKHTIQDTTKIESIAINQHATISYMVLAALIMFALWVCDRLMYH